jgi:hypothetical protein
LAHAMEKIQKLVTDVIDAVRSKNPLNTPNKRAADDVVSLQHELNELQRDPEANADEIERVEGELVNARENLSNTVADSDTFNFSDRTPTSSLERQMEGWQRQINVAESMGEPANPLYVGQVEGLRQEIERRKTNPDWVEPTPEGLKEKALDAFRRFGDFMSPDRPDDTPTLESPLPEGAFTLPPSDQTPDMIHEMEPITVLPTTRRLFEAAMDSIISPAYGSFVDEHDPAMFDDDSPFKPSTIELLPDEMESSVTGQSGLMTAPSAALIEKMENTSGGGSSRVNLSPTNVNVPVTNVTNNNSNIISPMPSPRNDNSSVLTFKNEQLVPNW